MSPVEELEPPEGSAGERRRLLVIAPYFPPRRRIGAQRAFKFVRYLSAAGIDPFVVSLATAGEALTEAERSALALVPRLALAAPFDRTGMRRPRSENVRGARGKGTRAWLEAQVAIDTRWPAIAEKSRAARAWLDARIPIDSWWPVLIAQLPLVLRAARDFAPHAVWSTADPWSSHALAVRVARRLEIPWIADFRDPWSLCQVRGRERPSWVRTLDAMAERAYLERAAAATFTAATTTARYRAAYPTLAERFHTIENSFDPASYLDPVAASQPPTAVAPEKELVLTFFGSFRRLSSAGRAIQLLARLRQLDAWAAARVRVRSQGGLDGDDVRQASEAGVREAFEASEPVPLERALAALRRSDLLLLSSESGRDEIIPAKLFDYLAAGRPVLSLCENPEIAAMLERCGAGVQFASDDLGDAARVLAACVRAKHEARPLPLQARLAPAEVAAFSAPLLTARLAALVRTVCAR